MEGDLPIINYENYGYPVSICTVLCGMGLEIQVFDVITGPFQYPLKVMKVMVLI